jgi:ABC-2 type transport system ATP-binding protein
VSVLVSATSLRKLYRGMDRPAIDDVTFTLDCGDLVGLLGPNGAGKTTLVKLLSGVTALSGGEVLVCGGDPVAHAATVKRDVAVVHQSMPMDAMLPAIDNVKIAAAFRGLRWRDVRPRVDALLAQFGLDHVAGQLAFTLSGGQRRRLQLVRALLVVPRLLILDEPSAGLDVQGRRQMWELIGKLKAEHGTTIIWTSHYIEEIERNCTRVLIIDGGRLIRDQDPSSLVAEFGTTSVLVRLPDPADHTRLLTLIPPESTTTVSGQEIRLSGADVDDHLAAVMLLVRDAATRGGAIEFHTASLEDAYLALTDKTSHRDS